MKKKKVWWLLLPVLCIAAISGGIILSGTTDTKAAPVGYTPLSGAPEINIIDSGTGLTTPRKEIPGEYSAYFQLNENTTYHSDNVSFAKTPNPTWEADSTATSITYYFEKNKVDSGEEQSIWIYNAGIYQGRQVTLKLVVDSMTVAKMPFHAINYEDRDHSAQWVLNSDYSPNATYEDMYLSFASSGMFTPINPQSPPWNGSLNNPGDYIDYHWEFYDAETGNPINYKGLWNAVNINEVKIFESNAPTDFSEVYVFDNSNISYQIENGLMSTIGVGRDATVNKPTRFSYIFDTGSDNRLDQKFTKSFEIDYATGMSVYYSSDAISRAGHAIPTVRGVVNDAKYNTSGYRDLHYQIIQTVSNNQLDEENNIDFRDDTFIIESTLPSTHFDIDQSRVTVTNVISGSNVTTDFDIQVSQDGQTVSVSPKNPKADSFNGNTFTIDVYATPNETFDLFDSQNGYVNNANSVDDGYMVFDLDTTQTTLKYSTVEYGEKNFDSRVEATSAQSKTLNEGVPSADPVSGLTIEINGDLATAFPDPTTEMVENITVDSNNESFDFPVTASLPETLPSTATAGTITVDMVLTTARGVTSTVPIEVLVVEDTTRVTATDNTGLTSE